MSFTKTNILHTRGILLLVATTLIWGTTFPVLKAVVASVSPEALIAARFVVAALVFSPWLPRFNTRLLRDGVLLGGVYLASYITLTVGVETIAASQAAFVLSLNVILVPLFGLLLGRRLQSATVLAAGLRSSGLGQCPGRGVALVWVTSGPWVVRLAMPSISCC